MIIASFRAARFIVLAVVTALVGVVVQKYFAGPAGFLQLPQVDRRSQSSAVTGIKNNTVTGSGNTLIVGPDGLQNVRNTKPCVPGTQGPDSGHKIRLPHNHSEAFDVRLSQSSWNLRWRSPA
jgi:hypothetical protein